MENKNIDNKLLIRTTGIREWEKEHQKDYRRCESTPYKALDELFKKYRINKSDKLVDFGCGRGRVALYTHNKHNLPVSGVELHDLTYDELVKNKRNYKRSLKGPIKDNKAPIYFEYGYAENYTIKDDENIFYFFNPFSVKIFSKVVKNILDSVKKTEREVDIIMYYPLRPFKDFLDLNTPFKKINIIRLPWKKDKRKKFVIYRYNPKESKQN